MAQLQGWQQFPPPLAVLHLFSSQEPCGRCTQCQQRGAQGADSEKQLQFLLKKLCPGSSSSEFLWTETSARSWSSLSVCWGGDLKDKLSHKRTVPHSIVIYGAASCKEADK